MTSCDKCKRKINILVLTNGYGTTIELCKECHLEYMKLTQKWLNKIINVEFKNGRLVWTIE